MPAQDETPWHALDVVSAVERLATDPQRGLDVSALGELRMRYGSNELPPARQRPLWMVFLNQFRSPLIYLLFGAAAVALLLRETKCGFAIAAHRQRNHPLLACVQRMKPERMFDRDDTADDDRTVSDLCRIRTRVAASQRSRMRRSWTDASIPVHRARGLHCLRDQRQPTQVHGLVVHVPVGAVVHDRRRDVWQQLHAGLREHERLLGLVRLVVQPQVHRLLDVHDDGRPERERRLFRRCNVSYHVHGKLFGELFRWIDLPAWLS